LGLAIPIGNIVSRRDAELTHNSVADGCAKLISSQSTPTVLIAKLDVSGITIRNRKLCIAFP
jgi:hypothetical protein